MVNVRPVTVHLYVERILGFAHLAFTLYIFPVIELLNFSTGFRWWHVLQRGSLHWESPL